MDSYTVAVNATTTDPTRFEKGEAVVSVDGERIVVKNRFGQEQRKPPWEKQFSVPSVESKQHEIEVTTAGNVDVEFRVRLHGQVSTRLRFCSPGEESVARSHHVHTKDCVREVKSQQEEVDTPSRTLKLVDSLLSLLNRK